MSRGIAGALTLLLLLGAGGASALDYGAVASPSAIVYDAPSTQGKKLYVVSRYTPLELVVTLSDWVKVRSQDGSLGWVEKRALGGKRYVVVTSALADVRQQPDDHAPVVFTARKQVALEFIEDTRAGWIRVRDLQGATGYVKATSIWGA
jgi:SH3-like domain-containing protein